MRVALAVLVLATSLWSLPAHAYEKFIPFGHAYTPDQESLPPLNSDSDRLNAQVDIIESEIYTRELQAKKFQSGIDQFEGSGNPRPGSNFINY